MLFRQGRGGFVPIAFRHDSSVSGLPRSGRAAYSSLRCCSKYSNVFLTAPTTARQVTTEPEIESKAPSSCSMAQLGQRQHGALPSNCRIPVARRLDGVTQALCLAMPTARTPVTVPIGETPISMLIDAL